MSFSGKSLGGRSVFENLRPFVAHTVALKVEDVEVGEFIDALRTGLGRVESLLGGHDQLAKAVRNQAFQEIGRAHV